VEIAARVDLSSDFAIGPLIEEFMDAYPSVSLST
jgi:hypothetical protein